MSLGGLGLLLGSGGDDDGLPQRYHVSRKVTYNGKPARPGTINFLPQDGEGQGASGPINDGAYDLTTLTPGDGAIPGTYRVTVTAIEATDASERITTRSPCEPASRKPSPTLVAPRGPKSDRPTRSPGVWFRRSTASPRRPA